MNKIVIPSILLLLANLSVNNSFAADIALPTPNKCPSEILNSPQAIYLSKAYPHFRLNWGLAAPGDEFYEKCKTMKFDLEDTKLFDCVPIPELKPFVNDINGLVIIGTPGRNFIRGSQFNDKICGLGKSDILIGGGGDDYIYGNGGPDYLVGREDNDHLIGGKGKDFLWGFTKDEDGPYIDSHGDPLPGTDNDYLYGGKGKDHLAGGPGDDFLYGENGKDYLNGGQGDDIIDGGLGKDPCVDNDGGVDECAASSASADN